MDKGNDLPICEPDFEKLILSKLRSGYGAYKIEQINMGNSPDRKYQVSCENDRRMFLRISPSAKSERLKRDAAVKTQLEKLGILHYPPLEIGSLMDYDYVLSPWLTGETLMHILPVQTESRQYELGKLVAGLLEQLHTSSIEEDLPLLKTMLNRVLTRFKKTEFDLFGLRDESALMLVCARLRHVTGSEWGSKRYLNMEHLTSMLIAEAEGIA